jgi:hypothetical protein
MLNLAAKPAQKFLGFRLKSVCIKGMVMGSVTRADSTTQAM